MITRWDDGRRGPAVADGLQLNDCLQQLQESAIDWPAHPDEDEPAFQQIFSATYPPDQFSRAIDLNRRHEGAISLLKGAVLNGEIELYVRPPDGVETPVSRSALIEFERETIIAGIYRPYNDRGWLVGRPLFVKRDKWLAWLKSHTNEEPTSTSNPKAPPVDLEQLRSWLLEQYRAGALTDGGRQAYPAAMRRFPNNKVKKQTVLDEWNRVKGVSS